MIGIFDSGLGGLTILKEIVRLLPTEKFVYVADQKNIPYATKSNAFLKNRANALTTYLANQGAQTVVVACNTATVAAIDDIRSQHQTLAVVGVEPAIKPASENAKDKGLLILATKSTLASQRLKQLITDYAANTTKYYQDMPRWVELVEAGLTHGSVVEEEVRTSLKPYQDKKIRSIVLACTHYPFFKAIIEKMFPEATVYDPSIPVALQVQKRHHSTGSGDHSSLKLVTSGNLVDFKKTTAHLLRDMVKVKSIEYDVI